MNSHEIKEVLDLAEKLRHIFVATADKEGFPHIAAAGRLSFNSSRELLAVTSWFCPATIVNLEDNKNISLVVWDPEKDIGYQLLGRVVDMVELGILNGYVPELESKQIFPQVQRELLVEVESIIEFKHAPHSDI